MKALNSLLFALLAVSYSSSAQIEADSGVAKPLVIEDVTKSMSKGELERLTRAYAASMSDIFGPDKDIPAPDMNTGQQEMAWIVDEYSKIKGQYTPAVITGKPISMGGSLGRVEATGRGVMVCTRTALAKMGLKPEECTCVVQGFGNVGSISAKLIEMLGVKIVGISIKYSK